MAVNGFGVLVLNNPVLLQKCHIQIKQFSPNKRIKTQLILQPVLRIGW